MRQSTTLPQTSVPLLLRVFAGCCKPLLDDESSRHYLRTPCMVAWTLTPWCPSSALTRFFPEGIGLTLVAKGSAHQIFPAMQLQQGHTFEAAVIPFMFKPPCSLGLPVAPTDVLFRLHGSQAVYTTHRTCGYPLMPCGIATCLTRAIDMTGLSPAGLRPCRLLPPPLCRAPLRQYAGPS
jgi:hypothetical protein